MAELDLTTLDPDDPDPDDLTSFSDFEVEQLNTPWEPPPGERLPSRKEWAALSRLDRYRWKATFGNDWQFGAPRGVRTAEAFMKLDPAERTAERAGALPMPEYKKLREEHHFDPTEDIQTPVRSDDTEDVEGERPTISVDGLAEAAAALATRLSEEELTHLEQTMRAEGQSLLKKVSDPSFPAEVRETVADLMAAVDGFPDAREQLWELSVLQARVTAAATAEFHAGLPAPGHRTFTNKAGQLVTVEVDDLGGQRNPVVVGTREEALRQIEAESSEAEFSNDPLALATAEFGQWDHAKRQRFARLHPAALDRMLEAASLAEERSR